MSQDRCESEGVALRELSSARKDAITIETALNETLLRTAKEEETNKKEIMAMKKTSAVYELRMAKLQTAKLETENYTSLIQRNIAIIRYNQLGNNHVPVPALPPLPIAPPLPPMPADPFIQSPSDPTEFDP